MIKKLSLLILIIFGVSSCGYAPMLSQNNNYNFNIVNLEFTGDTTINNFLSRKLKQYSNNTNNKRYKLLINSNYEKIIVAKDSTGNVTDLKLISTIDVTYSFDNELKKKEKGLRIK